MAVDETKIDLNGQTLYVWAAVDGATLKVVHVDVSPGRSSLETFLFLREVFGRYRGRPQVWTDRGP